MELTDQHIIVLLGVRDRETYRPLAKVLNRSLGRVQMLLDDLNDEELIELRNPGKKEAAPWKLTDKGKEWLKKHGYPVLD